MSLQDEPPTDTTPPTDPSWSSGPSPQPPPEINRQTFTFHRPWAYPKQLEAIYDPRRFSLIEASTKSGKTHGCICWLIEQAFTGGGFTKGRRAKNYWWVAPVTQQADIAFDRMVAYLPRELFTAVRSS